MKIKRFNESLTDLKSDPQIDDILSDFYNYIEDIFKDILKGYEVMPSEMDEDTHLNKNFRVVIMTSEVLIDELYDNIHNNNDLKKQYNIVEIKNNNTFINIIFMIEDKKIEASLIIQDSIDEVDGYHYYQLWLNKETLKEIK